MSVASAEVVIDAGPEEVWAVVGDPRNLTRWERHVAAVDAPEELVEGLEYSTEIRFAGVAGQVDVTVLEVDPPHFARLQLRGVLDATVTTRVTGLEDGRSVLEHEVDYAFGAGLIGSFAAKGLEALGGAHYVLLRGAQAQKRQIEQRAGGG
jgi:uncharacterized protein YndB with AHSA1/START domain